MADEAKVILAKLKSHYDQMAQNYALLEVECNKLRSKIATLESDITAKNQKIAELTNELTQNNVRYKNLQISQKAGLNDQQLRENKERYTKLVREIDKCISLLSK